eukprot:TRINITY_DN62895_c0_g2_i2.p1 TRINITY_DN62895_c0_g2~~TRINITY_DN62895_c0_g2_i2.p1  ORF type:complete len:221 (+),score=17.46 TRINITY_DN62895_c0_g2_i2:68-730(+)
MPLAQDPPDIEVANGMVLPSTGGISCFSHPFNTQKLWELPQLSPIPDGLIVRETNKPHFLWEPEVPMPLTEYRSLLETAGLVPPWVHIGKSGDSDRTVLPKATSKAGRFLAAAFSALLTPQPNMSEDELSDWENDMAYAACVIRDWDALQEDPPLGSTIQRQWRFHSRTQRMAKPIVLFALQQKVSALQSHLQDMDDDEAADTYNDIALYELIMQSFQID